MNAVIQLRKVRSWARAPLGAVAVTLISVSTSSATQAISQQADTVTISWDHIQGTSKTTPTMQVVVQPPFRPGSPVRKPIYQAIRSLNTRYIRLVPWMAQPRLAVAELSPPTAKGTSWDFSEIDPEVIPFLEATKGREPIINFSVIPRWMFKTSVNVTVPADPDKLVWNYSNITGQAFASVENVEFLDPSGDQIGNYYGRLVGWYTKGGFSDENGVYHRSGYHYRFPWWEVLSELDNGEDIKVYTKLYDSIVTAIEKVSPKTKFEGFSALCSPDSVQCSPEDIEYFLDSKNHAAGVPIDRISFHSYAFPTKGETADQWQYTFFSQADGFLQVVKFVDATRRRLRPAAGVDINEVGCVLPDDLVNVFRGMQGKSPVPVTSHVPEIYWNACGAYFAYIYTGLVRQGVDVVKASQLFGYPGQFPSVSMLYPSSGLPNARFRVLQLIVDNFRPGDKLVQTALDLGAQGDLSAQAFITDGGKRLLLVNKRNRSIDLSIKSDVSVSNMDVVDYRSAGEKPRPQLVRQNWIRLRPFAVAVIRFD